MAKKYKKINENKLTTTATMTKNEMKFKKKSDRTITATRKYMKKKRRQKNHLEESK